MTNYIIQFFYRTSTLSALSGSKKTGVGVDGSTNNSTTSIALSGTGGQWKKIFKMVTSSSSPVNPRYGLGLIQ